MTTADRNAQPVTDWRRALMYPQWMPPPEATMLDTLATLLPFPGGDRYVAWSTWLREGRDLGLLKPSEHYAIRNLIAENL